MKQSFNRDPSRLVVLKLIMGLMRSAHTAYFNRVRKFAPNSDYVLICLAVAIGEIDGKPLSASRISEYIGMPRVSVMRKLTELQARGLIERPARSKYTFGSFALTPEEYEMVLASMKKMIHRASTELSKLDR